MVIGFPLHWRDFRERPTHMPRSPDRRFMPGLSCLALLLLLFPDVAAAGSPTDEECVRECAAGEDEDAVASLDVFEVVGSRQSDVQPLRPDETPGGDSLSLGAMLRGGRSVTWSGDAGEYREPRIRGVGFGFTRVELEGRELPGQSRDPTNDRILSVGLLPAALFHSARVSTDSHGADGIAGTVELTLWPDAPPVRRHAVLGASLADTDDGLAPLLALRTPVAVRGQSWGYFAVAAQRTRNPKTQTARFFDDSRLNEVLMERNTLQLDSGGATAFFRQQLTANTSLELGVLHLFSEEEETEIARTSDLSSGEVDTRREDLEFDQYVSGISMDLVAAGNAWEHRLSTSFDDASFEEHLVGDLVEPILVTDGTEDLLRLAYAGALDNAVATAGIALSWSRRQRNERQRSGGDPAFAYGLKETVLASEARWGRSWNSASAELLLGVEYWDLEGPDFNDDRTDFLPSAGLVVPVRSGRVTIAVGRTLARPGLRELTPVLRPDQPDEDEATVGNPALAGTTANGIDMGLEWRAGNVSFRLNGFYRDLRDIVELVRVEADLFTFTNTPEGELYGIELSLWSDAIGRLQWPWKINYSRLESSVTDPVSLLQRPINDQPDYVLNGELTAPFADGRAAGGLRLYLQGPMRRTFDDERSRIEYDPNLDVFFRYSIRDTWLVHAGITNLLGTERRQATVFAGGDSPTRGVETEISERVFSIWFSGSW